MFNHQQKYAKYLFTGIFISAYTLSSSVFAEQDNNKSVNTKASPAPSETLIISEPPPALLPPPLARPRKDTFKQIDTNNDAKITFDELQAYKVKRKQERANEEADRFIKGCDKNKDGVVTLNELPNEEDMRYQMDDIEVADPDKIKELLSSRCMFPREFLEIMDLNEDGTITREEMMQGVGSDKPSKKVEKKMEQKMLTREAKRRKKQFVKCDSNSDEILTLREAVSMRCSLRLYTEQFDAYDTDGDGILTADELAKPVKPVEFKREEDPQYLARMKKMPPLERIQSALYECDKDEDNRLSKGEIIGAKCEQDLVYFDTVDHDQDGYITLEEIQRVRNKKQFDRMDKNKDGVLSTKEYKRTMRYDYRE